jgi:hypothetical protein
MSKKLTKLEKCIEEEMSKQKNLISMKLFNKSFCELSIGEIFKLEECIKNINNPIWKDIYINGEKTKYQVSNCGNIKNTKSGRILKHNIDIYGYCYLSISHKGNKYQRTVHSLVAQAFIPNPESKPQVNHKDGNKENNYDWNLEWATHLENMKHALETGLRNNTIGSNHSNSVYSDKQIHKICKLLENGSSTTEVSNVVKIPRKYLDKIRRGELWKHISKKYKVENSYKKRPK